ncbi:MAG: hypothetical protein KatS3mg020_0665 [Fimbriimonadales bacterium]|nr:MAG: hypothetical protein KatS3mg020_0665 [Fimbriimonadales bacterium]
MAYPARQPDEKPPLWIIQETFEGEQPAEQPHDVYILHLLRALPPALLESLSPEQYALLKQSLHAYHRRHLLDVRGVIPFLWTRFYFVFLFGKDTRTRDDAVGLERRRSSQWGRTLGWIVMLGILGLLLIGFLGAARLLTR